MMIILTSDVQSFAALGEKVRNLPNQVRGFPSAICETGEPYIEFSEYALARPDDVEAIERIVAGRMWKRLEEYLSARKGRIYWRVPFESQIIDQSLVVHYDENGPDKDLLTGRNCVLDRNWRGISCYCRLYRASCDVDLSSRNSLAA